MKIKGLKIDEIMLKHKHYFHADGNKNKFNIRLYISQKLKNTLTLLSNKFQRNLFPKQSR